MYLYKINRAFDGTTLWFKKWEPGNFLAKVLKLTVLTHQPGLPWVQSMMQGNSNSVHQMCNFSLHCKVISAIRCRCKCLVPPKLLYIGYGYLVCGCSSPLCLVGCGGGPGVDAVVLCKPTVFLSWANWTVHTPMKPL